MLKRQKKSAMKRRRSKNKDAKELELGHTADSIARSVAISSVNASTWKPSIGVEIVESEDKSRLRSLEAENASLRKRVTQLQVSDEETVRRVKLICSDVQHALGSKEDLNFQDSLAALSYLGRLCGRLISQKLAIEDQLLSKEKRLKNEQSSCDDKIQAAQVAVARLKDEKRAIKHEITELTLKFERDVQAQKEELQRLRWENKQLVMDMSNMEEELDKKEKKLMDMPRLEEQYLRSARGIVQKKNEEVFAKELQFSKMRKEVEACAYWRSRAQDLAVQVAEHRNQLDNVTKHGRQVLNYFQSTLPTARNSSPSRSRSPSPVRPSSALVFSGIIPAPFASVRPKSAPATRKPTGEDKTANYHLSTNGHVTVAQRPSSAVASAGVATAARRASLKKDIWTREDRRRSVSPTTGLPWDDVATKNISHYLDTKDSENKNNHAGHTGRSTQLDDDENKYKHLSGELTILELSRNRSRIQELEEKVNRLTTQLSLTRAYPLVSADKDDYSKTIERLSLQRPQSAKSARGGQAISATAGPITSASGETVCISPLKRMSEAPPVELYIQTDNDDDSLDDSVVRMQKATATADALKAKILRARRPEPPHVAAIRMSRSFGQHTLIGDDDQQIRVDST